MKNPGIFFKDSDELYQTVKVNIIKDSRNYIRQEENL
jgi:hypothetical protein